MTQNLWKPYSFLSIGAGISKLQLAGTASVLTPRGKPSTKFPREWLVEKGLFKKKVLKFWILHSHQNIYEHVPETSQSDPWASLKISEK